MSVEGVTNLVQSLKLKELGLEKWLAERKCGECDGQGHDSGCSTTWKYSRAHSCCHGCPSCHGTGKQPLWPALVWHFEKGYRPFQDNITLELLPEVPELSAGDWYVHALPYSVAFRMLADLFGWRIVTVYHNPLEDGDIWAEKDGDAVLAGSEPELLDKILAKEAK